MIRNEVNKYNPDVVSLPGDSLAETLEFLKMSQKELADRLGVTGKTINEIIKGKQSITPSISLRLELTLGIPASFWNNRQRTYDEHRVRLEEKRKLKSEKKWVLRFPYDQMAQFGWIRHASSEGERLQNLLSFFGVASPDAWTRYYWKSMRAAYRRSTKHRVDDYALAAWIRRGEIEARSLTCKPYSQDKFKATLSEVRKLTILPASVFVNRITNLCADAGVAVVFVRELPRTASGAARWLNAEKAIIQLSLKYRTDDHLWFAFFHEAAHVILHRKKDIFIESVSYQDDYELEADKFAEDVLIPRKDIEDFLKYRNSRSKQAIRDFSRKLGISPGIVVGRLQKMGIIPWRNCNDLKRRFQWK